VKRPLARRPTWLGGRRHVLRRLACPARPAAAWFVVDLLENADRAGVAPGELAETWLAEDSIVILPRTGS
jgi:hypothetical protein